MKKLLLLAFLMLGLTANSKVLGFYGGVHPGDPYSKKLDGQLQGENPINFSWQRERLNEATEAVDIYAKDKADLKPLMKVFKNAWHASYTFNEIGECEGGFVVHGHAWSKIEHDPFTVMDKAPEEFYIAAEGYYIKIG